MTLEVVVVPKNLYYHEVAYVRGLEAEVKRLRSALVCIEDVSFECDDSLGSCIRMAKEALSTGILLKEQS